MTHATKRMTLDSAAYAEMARIKDMTAFNLQGYCSKRALNQHSVRYLFPDGSRLQLDLSSQLATAWLGAFGDRITSHIRVNK